MADDKSKNPGCLLAFLAFFKNAGATEESLPYRVRDDFLSPAEASFYHVLHNVVKDQAVICTKVNLQDLFYVTKTEKRQTHFNRISRKHVDFLLCNSKTMKPIAGIELDDASHNRADREERDDFVDDVFRTAGLPLIRVKNQREYNPRELAEHISPLLTNATPAPAPPTTTPYSPTPRITNSAKSAPTPPATITSAKSVPICPKCGVEMVVRVSKQGVNAGNRFYGCPNFPKCREMRHLD